METVTLRYVGPHDAVEISATGDLVERDATVKVPAALAGRGPSGDPESEEYDRGEGLLAQEANWELADKATAPAANRRKPKTDSGEVDALEEGGDNE